MGDEFGEGEEGVFDDEAVDLCEGELGRRREGGDGLEWCCERLGRSRRLHRWIAHRGRSGSSRVEGARERSRAQSVGARSRGAWLRRGREKAYLRVKAESFL